MENGHIEENKLPKICVNDEFISRSPSPVSLQLNNIEKLDREGLIRKTNSPQTSSILNIADVNKITESVQSITVKLENLTGVQFTPGHVKACVGLPQVQHLVDYANKPNCYREEKCDVTLPS